MLPIYIFYVALSRFCIKIVFKQSTLTCQRVCRNMSLNWGTSVWIIVNSKVVTPIPVMLLWCLQGGRQPDSLLWHYSRTKVASMSVWKLTVCGDVQMVSWCHCKFAESWLMSKMAQPQIHQGSGSPAPLERSSPYFPWQRAVIDRASFLPQSHSNAYLAGWGEDSAALGGCRSHGSHLKCP